MTENLKLTRYSMSLHNIRYRKPSTAARLNHFRHTLIVYSVQLNNSEGGLAAGPPNPLLPAERSTGPRRPHGSQTCNNETNGRMGLDRGPHPPSQGASFNDR